MGNLPDPLNRRAAPQPQTLRSHFTDHACMAGGTSVFRSSRRRFTFSRLFFLASSSNFCLKIKKAAFSRAALSRWSSFTVRRDDKLNSAIIGLGLNVRLRFQEVARLQVDHLIQLTINKQTNFTAIYSKIPTSKPPHDSKAAILKHTSSTTARITTRKIKSEFANPNRRRTLMNNCEQRRAGGGIWQANVLYARGANREDSITCR
jgi:hypothetical protein